MCANKEHSGVFNAAGGFTLAELLLAIAIVAILGMVALPAYFDYRERVRIYQASVDIGVLNGLCRSYMADNRDPPDDLSAVGAAGKLDPWGKPYVYLNFSAKGAKGKARKNKNLTPINTDFDLYSSGRDGGSVPPLTAKISRDDVVLANDGRFVGLASTYEP
ncbi:MAG TPA: type II secretion system protein [Burkholderiales bacterium]|nr:type II secretion system protein [Burkholderiales bacterium]